MIITKTPFRLSFVGGGTDLRSYYKRDFGSVLSCSIDKYLYIMVRKQIGFVEFKYRINWSKVEFCNHIEKIKHPIVREALKLFKFDFPIEISTFSDIPANAGLGSSSAFAVGLVSALSSLQGKKLNKHEIASLAAHLEINILKRPVGKQDHFASSYGDMNIIKFYKNETVKVQPIKPKKELLKDLEDKLLLFYTSQQRDAAKILKNQNSPSHKQIVILDKMKSQVLSLKEVLNGKRNIKDFGIILKDSWILKKKISKSISSKKINDYFNLAMKAGAVGGKILGAGGGGFLLLYVDKINQKKVINALSKLHRVNFKFEKKGTILSYQE